MAPYKSDSFCLKGDSYENLALMKLSVPMSEIWESGEKQTRQTGSCRNAVKTPTSPQQ